ncbi:uncharacterized protein LOC128392926 [Panonychus citri]|uniref:uncharacterized protein LOC128392926 n=1 Tax=Panonychus citri TaxID=50023 RepID=UPI0023074E67|nr:uncharacterized protein LOC128392926 [Panonychus citri]
MKMFQFDCLLICTLIVTINCVTSSDQIVGNYNLTHDDFQSLCEQIGLLVASGIESDQVASIVTNQMLSKFETIKLDSKGKPSNQSNPVNPVNPVMPNKPPSFTDMSSDAMIVYTQGFINNIVQIILQVFTVENMVVNVAYAENLNMLIVGKRSTINSDGNDNHNHHRRSSNGSEICSQIDFPSQLQLNNQGEATKVLRRLSTNADNLINQLFKSSLRKSSPSSP